MGKNETWYRSQKKKDYIDGITLSQAETKETPPTYKFLPNHISDLLDVYGKEEKEEENEEENKKESEKKFDEVMRWLLAEENKELLKKYVGLEEVVDTVVTDSQDIPAQKPASIEPCEQLEGYRYNDSHRMTDKDLEHIKEVYTQKTGKEETGGLENMLLDLVVRGILGAEIKKILTEKKDGSNLGKPLYDEVHVYPVTLADRVRTRADFVVETKHDMEKKTFLISMTEDTPYAGGMYDWQQAQKEAYGKKRASIETQSASGINHVLKSDTEETIKKPGKRKRKRIKIRKPELVSTGRFNKTNFEVRRCDLKPGQVRRWAGGLLKGKKRYEEKMKDLLKVKGILQSTKADKKEADLEKKAEEIMKEFQELE